MSYRLRSSLASILLDGPRRVMGGYINTSIYCPPYNLSVRSLKLLLNKSMVNIILLNFKCDR